MTTTTGTIVFLLETRNFGFIKPQSGDKDIFVHKSNIVPSDVDAIRAGSRVQFEIGTSEKGKPQALHVKLLEREEATATDDGSQALAWNRTKERSQ